MQYLALGSLRQRLLMMATKSSIPPALYKISGVIGLEMTLFTWQNLVMISVLVIFNPFWMLPLFGVTGAKARDLAGYAILQLAFHIPAVLMLLWLLGKTLPYVAPVMQF